MNPPSVQIDWALTGVLVGLPVLSFACMFWLFVCYEWRGFDRHFKKQLVIFVPILLAALAIPYGVERSLNALPYGAEDTGTAEYDVDRALDMALFSALAYENRSRAAQILDENGYSTKPENFGFFVWDSHAVLVLLVQGELGIAFRGSDDFDDWLTNLDMVVLETETGYMHRGFYRSVEPALEYIEPWLQEASSKGVPVWLGGHSLGGAMALVTALRIAESSEVDIGGVMTFGQPSVGLGKVFRVNVHQVLGDLYFRHVNSIDIVPLITPAVFQHVGALVYFDRDGLLTFGEPALGTRFAQGVWRAPGQELKSHEMQGYVALLQKLKANSQCRPTHC